MVNWTLSWSRPAPGDPPRGRPEAPLLDGLDSGFVEANPGP
jgi:hypothetical protein